MSLLFVMLDGVGLAPTTPANPLSTAPMPTLQALLGGPLTLEQTCEQPSLLLRPIDATLGVPGLPQSGTGHTALYTGVNAAQLIGHHQPAFPAGELHELLATQSLFQRIQARGYSLAFANAYSPAYWQALAARRLRRSASTIAAQAAGLPLRTLDDLRAGKALYWDIDGSALATLVENPPPPIAPAYAGATLVALARHYDLVVYECYLLDLAAHGPRRSNVPLNEALGRVDGFIGGIIANLAPDDTLVVTSDHGNCEDGTTTSHTRNPVPLLVVGPHATTFATITSIVEVANALVQAL